jgi:hypothetical protein
VLTVGQFVQQQKLLKKLEKNPDVAGEIEAMMELIQTCFPTLPSEHLEAMTIEQLGQVINFISGVSDQDNAGAETAQGEATAA